ncbi:MAG: hypothetical protein SGPRY_014760, partial [Prymnesium sp.]
EGRLSHDDFNEAARSVMNANGRHVNWQTIRNWLRNFAKRGGRFLLDQRGRPTKTASFLEDNTIKVQAREWLRTKLRAARSRSSARVTGEGVLTIDMFHCRCNAVPLMPMLEAESSRKPISRTSCRSWLKLLGFSFKPQSKNIYYDSHEREDVVRDRMEKLVMLKVLEEVTAHFTGKNCEEMRWPLLHPN